MAPSEMSILGTNLLIPAQLPTILSLKDFTALFPKAQQASPHIRELYRDIQRQRQADIDQVEANIEREVQASNGVRRAVLRAKREARDQGVDEEIEIERALFASTDDPKHSLFTIIPELDSAVQALEAQIQRLAEDEAKILEAARAAIGNMSDLRYGRLSNPQLKDQIIEGLQNVQATCARRN